MASVPTDGAAMKAVRAFGKLTAMIESGCQLGPAGFNEGEFNSTICTMWTNFRHPDIAPWFSGISRGSPVQVRQS
jgi:hypothetical protein